VGLGYFYRVEIFRVPSSSLVQSETLAKGTKIKSSSDSCWLRIGSSRTLQLLLRSWMKDQIMGQRRRLAQMERNDCWRTRQAAPPKEHEEIPPTFFFGESQYEHLGREQKRYDSRQRERKRKKMFAVFDRIQFFLFFFLSPETLIAVVTPRTWHS
jgi:hypothetical protein